MGKKKRQKQRWALLADLHCGATTGLATKPDNDIQTNLLQRYKDCIKYINRDGYPDVVLINGDAIDGTDEKSRDLTEECMFAQCRDAAELISKWGARKEYILISGTPYHTQLKAQKFEYHLVECLENILARNGQPDVKVTYERKLNTTINDWFLLQAKHKVGRSNIPYSRNTAPQRSQMWGVLNAAFKAMQESSPIVFPALNLFAHVHYYTYAENGYGRTCTLPCWQAVGSEYGDTQCEGHIDVGACAMDIGTEEGDFSWESRLYPANMVHRGGSR